MEDRSSEVMGRSEGGFSPHACPCRRRPEFERQRGAVGFLPWGQGSTSGFDKLGHAHSVSFVAWLTDSCALFAPANPARGSSPILGPLSVEPNPFLALEIIFPESGP